MPPHFVGPLRIEQVSADRYRLIDAVTFYSVRFSGWFVVPAGFETDFNSVPRLFWSVIPKQGKASLAGVLHDAGYHGALRTLDGQRIRLIRSHTDTLFDEALQACGVSKFVRGLMVAAVRKKGAGAYADPLPPEAPGA